jgi:hypothetical protein
MRHFTVCRTNVKLPPVCRTLFNLRLCVHHLRLCVDYLPYMSFFSFWGVWWTTYILRSGVIMTAFLCRRVSSNPGLSHIEKALEDSVMRRVKNECHISRITLITWAKSLQALGCLRLPYHEPSGAWGTFGKATAWYRHHSYPWNPIMDQNLTVRATKRPWTKICRFFWHILSIEGRRAVLYDIRKIREA